MAIRNDQWYLLPLPGQLINLTANQSNLPTITAIRTVSRFFYFLNNFLTMKTNFNKNTFEGTREAFGDLISRPLWYANINVNGFPITSTNASQIKFRFSGRAKNPISLDYMEQVLTAAGYKVLQPIVWGK